MKKMMLAVLSVFALQTVNYCYAEEAASVPYSGLPVNWEAPHEYPVLNEYPIISGQQNYQGASFGPIVGNSGEPFGPANVLSYESPYGTIVNPPEPPADCLVYTSQGQCGEPGQAIYCHYEPCYYDEWCCDKTLVKCKRRFCQYVPQFYEVELCRMVPQYYKQTFCRYVPEWGERDEYVPSEQWRCETRCQYVPHYYCVCESDAECCDDLPMYGDWSEGQAWGYGYDVDNDEGYHDDCGVYYFE